MARLALPKLALSRTKPRPPEGITPGLIRLSVGLEDPEDLWSHLAGALEAFAAGRGAERVEELAAV